MRRLVLRLALVALPAAAPPARAGDAGSAAPGNFRVRELAGGAVEVTLGLPGDAPVTFALPAGGLRAAAAEFGYSGAEVARLTADCLKIECSHEEMSARASRFYLSRGVEITLRPDGEHHAADLPRLIARNRARVAPAARAIRAAADARGFDRPRRIAYLAALVQQALPYREIPGEQEDRRIFGLLPPPLALVAGGDCDTKSALLAALLLEWGEGPLLGLKFSAHYLLAMPAEGLPDGAGIVHAGKPYRLIEAAGPAPLPPGQIGDETRAFLESERPEILELK